MTRPNDTIAVADDDVDDVDEYEDDEGGAGGDLPFDPSTFGRLADEIDEWTFDHCAIKVGSAPKTPQDPPQRVLYPFSGQAFWLLPYGPIELDNALLQFAGGAQDERPADMASSFEALCEGLARLVVGWTLEDPIDGPYPQPWKNPDAFRMIPSEAFYYIIQIYRSGEYPEARPNASGRRLGTSGIRRSSGQKTKNSSTGRRRR